MSEVEIIKANPKAKTKNRNGDSRIRVCAYCRVSTINDEQIDSFNSQVSYYKTYISKNPEWINAGIYADEGITGTSVDKRPEFLRMISDCMAGKIDLILVKSISRFARNTVDTLNYVRALREKKVAILFEEERIDTSNTQGEFLLTILGSLAQQEVTNTSEHVKKGLEMKMSRGELVGFNACLGYDYHKDTKSITINQRDAKIVQHIFKRYLEGAGTTVLARELTEAGYKTIRGSTVWSDSTILGIIKNEKYKGSLLQGKTYTVDPISGKRLDNKGETNQFFVSNHHEAIISEEDWEKANELLKSRSYCRRLESDGTRSKYSRQYDFSSLMECGFCHHNMCRRNWRSGKAYNVVVWQCQEYAKKGKEKCPNSKGIPEETIKGAFVEAYNRAVGKDSTFLEDFIKKSENILERSNLMPKISENKKDFLEVQNKLDKLGMLYVANSISKEMYDKNVIGLNQEKEKLIKAKDNLEFQSKSENDSIEKIKCFRNNALKCGTKKIKEFDRSVFDTCVEKIIVGGFDDSNIPDPFQITFVFKKGLINLDNQPKHAQGTLTTVIDFKYFWRHSVFNYQVKKGRIKSINDFIKIQIKF